MNVFFSFISLCTVFGGHNVTVSNSSCRFKVYDIEDTSYAKLGWNGKALMDHCAIGFRGEDSDLLYTICVDVQKYRIHDQDFVMEFYKDDEIVQQVGKQISVMSLLYV